MMRGNFETSDGKLIFQMNGEKLCVEAWGENALRVRASQLDWPLNGEDYALLPVAPVKTDIHVGENGASITNGKIRAEIDAAGRVRFFHRNGRLLLSEYARDSRSDNPVDQYSLEVHARTFQAHPGGAYRLTVRFESDPAEKIFGMGQYQQDALNLKGCHLELAQRNSQASVPFHISSKGYGFLWNNPAVGEAVFAKNCTLWRAETTRRMDYWVTAGETPAEILASYTAVSGRVPAMPEYGLGFWQCKLRYQTQEELLQIAREHKRRGLPMDVIVVDYFHWPMQGDWCFDKTYWPDPDGMIRELKAMGIEVMVSIWPTVDRRNPVYTEMQNKGLLVRADRGVQIMMDLRGQQGFIDTTNPETQSYVWERVKSNYYDKGVKLFWLDEAEPEYEVYDFDNYRYHMGSCLEVGNIYPMMYAKGFYDGMRASGMENVVNLVRCAWAGSQRYGALVWSGDIASTFESLRFQLSAGLGMGMAGIPWWTTDIGGFHGGNGEDPEFRELFARWFEWGAFCPVMRLHGFRLPRQPQYGTTGGCECRSGAPNEVWSFGEEVYEICKKYLSIRESIREKVRTAMLQAHETGAPVMRPMFFEFPGDETCWNIEDEYMLGGSLLVAPVMRAGQHSRPVYLPEGLWKPLEGGADVQGGRWIEADAPLDRIPVYVRANGN